DWVGLKSSGGVEDVKLPNPGTFGEIVYQERYRRTFDGKFVLNDELASYEGQHLPLQFLLADNGDNEVYSEVYDLFILRDSTPPVVRFFNYTNPVYQYQNFKTNIEVTDETLLNTVSISVRYQDGTEKAIKTADNIAKTSYRLHNGVLDFSTYIEQNGIGPLQLVVRASDVAGNLQESVLSIQVEEDPQPEITLSGMYPSPDALAGGTSLYQLHLTDNTAEYPVYHGSFYTSLSGISNASRAVNVAYAYEEKIEESGEGFKSSLVSPVYKNIISWIDYAEYPSAAAFAITGTYGDLLNIESGRLGVAYGDTKERIKSLSGMPLDDLVTVTIRASDQCHSDSVKQVKIADLEDFLKELNSGTGIHSYRIDIDNPDVPVRAIEQQLG